MQSPHGEIPDRYGSLRMADAHEHLEGRRISRRRLLQGAGALTVGAFAGPTLWRRPARAAVPPAGLHLTYGLDPRTTLAVSWSTPEAVADPTLDLGLDAGFGLVVPAETRTVAGTSTHYHHAVITGLEPATTYRYRVRHAGGEAPMASLTTAPDAAQAQPFTFTAFGDQGVSANAQATTATAAAQRPAFHLHAGDLCYAYSSGNGTAGPTDQAVWDRWFDQISPLASGTPWMPAVGNHEMEVGYGEQGYGGILSRFTLPGGGPSPVIHSFRYGNVAVLSLDGNDASTELTANRDYTAGAQERWLEASLATYRSDPTIDFLVAQFHHCSYCTNAVHASDGGVRERWGPLFDQYAVDLVINGHNHCYERTHPVRDGVPTTEVAAGGVIEPAAHGTTYITAGGGGQAAYQATLFPVSYVTEESGARVPEEAPWSATRYLDVSLLAVDVLPAGSDGVTTMTLRALQADGTPIESVTLRRTSAVATAARAEAAAGLATAPSTPEEAVELPRTGPEVPIVAGAALAAGAVGAHMLARAAGAVAVDHEDR